MESTEIDLGLKWSRPIDNRHAKEAIASLVAKRVEGGQVIGAGSGSTSFLAVLAIGERARQSGLKVTLVPTSLEIQLACEAVGLPTTGSVPTEVDWCFDGADEVDPLGRMIKGRGGALYRERLVFAAATHRVVVADQSKSVERLGSRVSVPVEVDPPWVRSAYARLDGWSNIERVELRLGIAKDGPVITEMGGLILDVKFRQIAAEDEEFTTNVPGVRCTGIFSGFAFERLGG